MLLLVLFLFAAAFILQADDAAPIKWSFMELFIASGSDTSLSGRTNDPFVAKGDYASDTGFYNVFDISVTVPIKKTDMVDASAWYFFEWGIPVNGTSDEKISNWNMIFQPQVKIGKYYTFYAGDECNWSLSLNLNGVGQEPFYVPTVSNIIMQKNDLSIPKVLEIWVNEAVEWDYTKATIPAVTGTSYTAIKVMPAWQIGGPGLGDNWHFGGGSIWTGDTDDQVYFHFVGPQYESGFGWNLAQQYQLKFAPQNDRNNDPLNVGKYGAGVDAPTQNSLYNETDINTFACIVWDFMKLAKVKDFSLTAIVADEFDANMPYSTVGEVTKTFTTEGAAGVEFGFYGFQLGGYVQMNTSDTYNKTKPISDVYDKRFDIVAKNGIDHSYTDRAIASGEIGPAIEFQYFGNNIGFRIRYLGQGEFRDVNTAQGFSTRPYWTNKIRLDYFIFF